MNSKKVLEVNKFTSKRSIEDLKFSTGDRIVQDSSTKVFLLFKGLDEEDTIKKGKYVSQVEYATVTYEWYSKADKVNGVSLPNSAEVEVGTKYTIRKPADKNGYTFDSVNYSGSITVNKDITVYISSEYIGEGGYAGSQIPLADNYEEVEYQVRHRVPSLLTEMLDDYVFSVNITNITIKNVAGKSNEVDVTVEYDAYLKDDVNPNEVSSQGHYNSEDNCIEEMYQNFRLIDEGVGDIAIQFRQ